MTSVKKIKVALLALVAALVIAIPTSAFAAQDITVTSKTSNDGYKAVQVFEADVDANNQLTNIKWGKDITPATLITNLSADTDFAAAKAAQEAANKPVDAAFVAQWLGTAGDAKAAVFADAVANARAAANNGTPLEYVKGSSFTYKASVEKEGYYLVIQDTAGTYTYSDGRTQEGALTKFIVKVVGDTAVVQAAKTDVPSVTKEVKEDRDGSWGATADDEIGKAIDYRITGTIPTNYDLFKSYHYEFTDTMSKGLTLDQGTIAVKTSGGVDITDMFKKADGSFDVTTTQDGKTVLVLKAADLKADDRTKNLTSSDTIIVTYQAKLNADCVVGMPGNPNTVNLKYSRDPNTDGGGEPGTTPDEECIVFTYELDTLKKGQGQDADKLEGAKFVLYNADKSKVAKVVNGRLVSWDAVADAQENDEFKAEYVLTSGSDGHFKVAGLDEVKGENTFYILTEIFAPEGYAVHPDVKIVIDATTGADASGAKKILTLKIEVDEGDPDDGDLNSGVVNAQIINVAKTGLPSTGGIGTTIFTIVGIALIVAAAAIMVIRRRNAAAIQ